MKHSAGCRDMGRQEDENGRYDVERYDIWERTEFDTLGRVKHLVEKHMFRDNSDSVSENGYIRIYIYIYIMKKDSRYITRV